MLAKLITIMELSLLTALTVCFCFSMANGRPLQHGQVKKRQTAPRTVDSTIIAEIYDDTLSIYGSVSVITCH